MMMSISIVGLPFFDESRTDSTNRQKRIDPTKVEIYLHSDFLTSTLSDVLPVTIIVAVQAIHYKGVCPYPAHLFIDVLAQVGYVRMRLPLFRCA